MDPFRHGQICGLIIWRLWNSWDIIKTLIIIWNHQHWAHEFPTDGSMCWVATTSGQHSIVGDWGGTHPCSAVLLRPSHRIIPEMISERFSLKPIHWMLAVWRSSAIFGQGLDIAGAADMHNISWRHCLLAIWSLYLPWIERSKTNLGLAGCRVTSAHFLPVLDALQHHLSAITSWANGWQGPMWSRGWAFPRQIFTASSMRAYLLVMQLPPCRCQTDTRTDCSSKALAPELLALFHMYDLQSSFDPHPIFIQSSFIVHLVASCFTRGELVRGGHLAPIPPKVADCDHHVMSVQRINRSPTS